MNLNDGENSWFNKLIFGITLSIFVITICMIGIIVSLYFFVTFVSSELTKFISSVPPYQATLGAFTGISLTYILKRFK
jgi:hypothetical protein